MKEPARDEHSSLFVLSVRGEEKRFIKSTNLVDFRQATLSNLV